MPVPDRSLKTVLPPHDRQYSEAKSPLNGQYKPYGTRSRDTGSTQYKRTFVEHKICQADMKDEYTDLKYRCRMSQVHVGD